MTDQQQQQTQQAATVDAPASTINMDAILAATERELAVKSKVFEYDQRIAGMFARSGCFADIKGQTPEESIARAMVKIEIGRVMGFTQTESMTGIDIIKGRPAIGANLRASRMRLAGYDWPAMELNDKGCWLPLERGGKPMLKPKMSPEGTIVCDKEGEPIMEQVMVSFTEADAQRAGLLQKEGSNYKPYPRNMYFARAITNAQRWYAPEVLRADLPATEEVVEMREAAVEVQMPQRASGV